MRNRGAANGVAGHPLQDLSRKKLRRERLIADWALLYKGLPQPAAEGLSPLQEHHMTDRIPTVQMARPSELTNNAAYILKRIRDSGGITWTELLEHFTPKDCRPSVKATTRRRVYNHVSQLVSANLVEVRDSSRDGQVIMKWSPDDNQNKFLMVSGFCERVQIAVDLSLRELAVRDQRFWAVAPPAFGRPSDLSSDVFVLMPFVTKMKPIYDKHIKKVADQLKLRCCRADENFLSHEIMADIWSWLFNSKLIVADCTGNNYNVYYELGIAHTLGKTTLIITQNPEEMPFDIRSKRYIRYEYTPDGMQKLEKTLAIVFGELVR
jgi:hypothetical protein